jgi:hypothetical protein
MATWKKVIVSGSQAELATLKVDNLTSGNVVIGGGSAGNLSTTAINGTGNIVATTGASGLVHSGSFSGSFVGNGSGLSGVAASFPATEKTNLVSTDKFFIQNSVGLGSEYATYGNLLIDLAGTNLAVDASDSLTLASTITGITSISSTAFTGSLLGTASYANNADTLDGLNSTAFVLNSQTSSMSVATASFVATASYANNANLLDGLDSTVFATTGSNTFRGNQVISGSLDVIPTGTAVAELVVTATGVNIGNLAGDNHNVTGSFRVNGAVIATNFTGSILGTASFADRATTASFASTASFATTAASATQVANSLTAGSGLTGTTFNGGAASTFDVGAGALITVTADAVSVSTSSLVANQIPKLSGGALAGSNISDTGTQVQISATATSGLSVGAGGISVAAGGVNVTGNSQFNNNVTIAGDLAVNGTTTFINTTNTYVKDQFVLIASGSTSLVDAGIVAQYNAAGSGSAIMLEAASAGTYGRWAVAYDVIGTATAVSANEFVVTAKINQASNPSAAPTWGGSGNGSGNIWVTNGGDIFIYA